MKRGFASFLLVGIVLVDAVHAAGCHPSAATAGPTRAPVASQPPLVPPPVKPVAARAGPKFEPSPDEGAARVAAERRKIDDEVRKVLAGQHGTLPPVDRVSSGGMGVPTVEVANDTEAFLMVLFSGACSARVLVPPRQRAVGTLCAGPYTLAARLLTSEVQPYVRTGQDFVDGSTYRLTFFVIWQKAGR